MNCPCYNCTERSSGCHSNCEKYAEYYNKNQEKLKQKYAYNEDKALRIDLFMGSRKRVR